MKIIHFADLHLGVESYGHIDAESGLSSRFVDFLCSFDRLVDYAIKEKVDLVLFCGDAYKSRDPSQTQQREFARRIRRLVENGIPVFLLVGNHDLPNASGRANTIEIYDTLGIQNVYVAERPGIFRILTPSGIIQVVALPWLKRSSVMSREDARNLDFTQLNQKLQQILSDIIDRLASELDPALPAVLAAHVWVQGARVGSEDTMSIGQEHMLLVSSVARPCFDYVALGHIHRHQVLHENPPVIYSGSLERLDFGDEDDEKGFYLINIEGAVPGKKVSYEFQGIEGRRFLTIKADLDIQEMAPTEAVLAILDSYAGDISGNIVRLEINLPQECEATLDETRVRRALEGAYYLSIMKNIRRHLRPRMGSISVEMLTPEKAFKTYINLKRSDYSEDLAAKILETGMAIIKSSSDNPDS
jgi:exonuclease SbcD